MIPQRFLGLLFATLVPCLFSHAQESGEPPIRTLFGSDRKHDNGGWGGLTTNMTSIMGQEALLVGARGGWLIDHGFTLGFAGHGLVTDVKNASYDAARTAHGDTLTGASIFRTGYGGLFLEPIIAPSSPVHISLPILIGAGGCGYQTYGPRPHDVDPWEYKEDFQAFFVLEPGVELEFNLVQLVRLGAGVSYRYTTDIDLPGTPKDALRGLNAGLTVKIGRF